MSVLSGNQRTTSRALIVAIVENAEAASLGRAVGSGRVKKLIDCADARKWFMDMELAIPGQYDPDTDEYAGFCAGFCLRWVVSDIDEYMSGLVRKWQVADEKLMPIVRKYKRDIAMLKIPVERRSKKERVRTRRDKITMREISLACDAYLSSVHRYKEMYNV